MPRWWSVKLHHKQKILDEGYFQNLFIPASEPDEGIPLGCSTTRLLQQWWPITDSHGDGLFGCAKRSLNH